MTGGPHLSATASGGRCCAGRREGAVGCWAAAGPREGDEANQAGSPRASSGLWPTGRASWAGL